MKKILLVLVCSVPLYGQVPCYAITPATSGSGTGASWTNAHGGIPTSLTRGTRYYFADGSYSAFTFSTAASGTSVIEFRKAQAYDFGRSSDGCSNDISAGFSPTTMGAGQASFPRGVVVSAPYFTWNGNGTSIASCGRGPGAAETSQPITPSDCGFLVHDTSGGIGVIEATGSSTNNYTFKYMEWWGDSTPSANEDAFFWAPTSSGPSTVTNIYGHDTGAVWEQDGCDQRTDEFNYFWGTQRQGTLNDGTHGQAVFCTGTDSNITFAYNVYRDTTGTAIWSFLTNNTGPHNNVEVYGNVVWNDSTVTHSLALNYGTTTTGVFICGNTNVYCTNTVFVQNTIVNGGYDTSVYLDYDGTSGPCTGNIQNNIWYDVYTGTAQGSPSFPCFSGTPTQDHNSFLAAGGSCPSGAGNVCSSGASSPFTNWPSGIFTLTSDSSNVNNRTSLSSPYNTDAAGNTFTSDRGAYQFISLGAGGVFVGGPQKTAGSTLKH